MAKTPSSGTSKSTTGSAASKAANAKSVATKRDTLVSLRKHMDDIAARLNQADMLTQQSIGSVQNAFSVLERRVNHEGSVNKAALTKRVDQLTKHLTGLIAQTRAGVAQDLRQAQDNPTLTRLQAAVAAAESRVSDAELSQADALTKVNRHVAQLARAVDTRFAEEAAARSQALSAVQASYKTLEQQTHKKISEIEQSSAQAIVRLGEHVVALSDDFKQRTDNNTQAVSAKMSTLALKTQKEFEDYRSQIERRMESLEENQRNLDSYTDRSLAGLTTRIDNLEYGLTTAAPPAASGGTSSALLAPESPYDDPFAPDPVAVHSNSAAAAAAPEPLLLEPELMTPKLKLVPNPAPTPAPAPVQTPKPFMTPPAPGAGNAAPAPVEFVPEIYIPGSPPSAPAGPAPLIQDIVPVPPESLAGPQAYEPSPAVPSSAQVYVASDSLAISGQTPSASDMAVADLIGADDLPYDDPAYAENTSGGNMKRPGAFDLKRKSAPKAKGSGRNIRVGMMAVCIAAVGYFALRGYIGREEDLANGSDSLFVETVEPGTAPIASASGGVEIAPSTEPAIGEYQDNQGQAPQAGSSSAASLEAAAESGDPVAEFQLGLSRLEAGQTKQAIDLIRASANKGQPAAQYRLAKLYEAGQGVTADAKIARQLTERAAASGNRIAMHDLALYYAEGRGGVETSIKTAASWFEKAAQRGVVDSQYNLGVLYESGQGMPKNLTEAFVWYSIAAGQGDQFARKHIEQLKQQLSAADVKRAEARVSEFSPIALDEEANGIFKNVSWARPASQSEAVAKIHEAQTLLGQLGYNVGRPDGSMGPQTRQAIASFQKDRGLTETGRVDAALVVQLQRAAGA